jgi:hypothetical protein
MRKKPDEMLTRDDWDFSGVPDSELFGCCYWEYARESAFIRDVRQRCLESRRTTARRDEQLHVDCQRLESIGYISEVFLRGCSLEPGVIYQGKDDTAANYCHSGAPPITGSFPDAWQSLSPGERAYRARLANYGRGIVAVPIERGHGHEAEDIAKFYRSKWNEILSVFYEVQRQNPGKSESQLCDEGKLPPFEEIPPSLFWESGREVTVLRIAWANYTNDEIANYFRRWVKAHRPKEIPVPSNQGRKRISDRVKLERLAIMRLLHPFTVAELRTVCPDAWKCYDTSNRRWRTDVNKAHAHFRALFPFLAKDEFPRSWPQKD